MYSINAFTKNKKSKKGFTLLELLVASFIMSMVTMSMLQLFRASYESFLFTASDIKAAQDALYAFDEVGSKMKMALRPGWELQQTGSVTPTQTALDPRMRFFPTGGVAQYSGVPLTTNGDAVLLHLTTYRSNDNTADNIQKYGMFEGTVEGEQKSFLFSRKARVVGESETLWGTSLTGSEYGVIAFNIGGMRYEPYTIINCGTPSANQWQTVSAGGLLYDSAGNWPKGVRITAYVTRKVKEAGGKIVDKNMPYSTFTSMRYLDHE